ncbi:MAG TPA: hypothetical protein VF174_07475 [Micromonosporaceae bacterium]
MSESHPARHVEELLGHGRYRPGSIEEVTLPPTDVTHELQERDVGDPAKVGVNLDELRDGGPTEFGPAVTTTGGTAGPASTRRRPAKPGGRGRGGKGKVAQTTTGDATSGGRTTPSAGSTSDAEGPGSQVGNFTKR